jgi:7,8-didemethyl-8-hydroxy-5-deazariboflavin synthase CofG subunit
MAHERAPDKRPELRLRMIAEAGALRIPFTTGILVGIGETWEERIDSLLAIRELHDRFGHIQEVIVQNFHPKPSIPLRDHPAPGPLETAKAAALARLLLGGEMNLQVPPNLSAEDYPLYLQAGINDWGGVSPLTPDFINPEAPWPHLEELRQRTEEAGFSLRARLPVYPEWIDRVWPPLLPHVSRLAGADGLVAEGGPLHGHRVAVPV